MRTRIAFNSVAAILAAMLLTLVMSTPANAAPGIILQAWADAKNQTVFVRSGTYNQTTQTGFGLAKIQ